jgi:hypothetical protein
MGADFVAPYMKLKSVFITAHFIMFALATSQLSFNSVMNCDGS